MYNVQTDNPLTSYEAYLSDTTLQVAPELPDLQK